MFTFYRETYFDIYCRLRKHNYCRFYFVNLFSILLLFAGGFNWYYIITIALYIVCVFTTFSTGFLTIKKCYDFIMSFIKFEKECTFSAMDPDI